MGRVGADRCARVLDEAERGALDLLLLAPERLTGRSSSRIRRIRFAARVRAARAVAARRPGFGLDCAAVRLILANRTGRELRPGRCVEDLIECRADQ